MIEIYDILQSLPSLLIAMTKSFVIPYMVGVKVKRKIVTVDRTLERKMDERYEGPLLVKEVLSGGMSYVVEGCGKKMKVHYSHLNLWADPPLYLEEYYGKQERLNGAVEMTSNEYVGEMRDVSDNERVHEADEYTHEHRPMITLHGFKDKYGQKTMGKDTWKELKEIACQQMTGMTEAGKKVGIDVSIQTEMINMVDCDMQTEECEMLLISPIRCSEMIDWFEEEGVLDDIREITAFDIAEFERDLYDSEVERGKLGSMNYYSLGIREYLEGESLENEDASIDISKIAAKLGIVTQRENMEEDELFFECLEDVTNEGEKNNKVSSPIRTRSKGPVEKVLWVQEETLEYSVKRKNK
jgi:hypothetical protein